MDSQSWSVGRSNVNDDDDFTPRRCDSESGGLIMLECGSQGNFQVPFGLSYCLWTLIVELATHHGSLKKKMITFKGGKALP